MFERAVASDPRYAAAYVGLGWTYVLEWSSFWTHDPQGLEQAFVLAQTALALNSALPHAHALLASVYLLRKQYEYAVTEGERAVTLDPTCADCYATLADILAFAGRARKAIELVEIARSLDPFPASSSASLRRSALPFAVIGMASRK